MWWVSCEYDACQGEVAGMTVREQEHFVMVAGARMMAMVLEVDVGEVEKELVAVGIVVRQSEGASVVLASTQKGFLI